MRRGAAWLVTMSVAAMAFAADSLESRIDDLISTSHAAEAVPLVQQLAAQRSAQGDPMAHAQALQVLGSIAEPSVAWPALQQALQIYTKANADEATLGAVEDAAALTAQRLNRYDDAERLFRAALKHREAGGPEPWLNTTRVQLAKLLLVRGRYEESATLIALAVPDTLAPDARTGLTVGMVVQRLQGLAHFHQATGSYADAVKALRRALAVVDDPALRNDLGMALFRLGRTAEAKAEFESARAAYRTMKPVPNEALAMCVNNLATLHLSTRDGPSALACLKELPPATEQAADLPRLINQGTALHLCGELDAAQAAMAKALDLIRRDLGAHHPLRIQALTNAAAIAADQHRDDEAKQFAREASSASRAWFEEVRAHADERQLLAMRRTFDPISPLAAFAGDDVTALADTVLAMKGVVLREALALRQHRPAPTTSAAPEDAVFVDYVLHSAYAGGGRWETRYAVLVLRPHEAAQWLPLGDADAIHRQVRSVLDAMETSVTAGKPSRSLALQLQALWSRLLPESLLAMVRDQRLIIRPDGLLHFVPWAVLIDPKSPREAPRFLCQAMPRVEFTAFARDMERVADKPVSWSVLTVPDKPARRTQATSVTQHRLANELASMPALPGTRREAEAIALAGTCTVKHAATESDLRAALDAHPTVLHLACHAFALGNDAAGTEDDSVLTRSGLVLADASADGSGILFADEAAALPLSDTNLVLLSACHTALGEADAGGDLTSLRHALLSAGARNVMSALWSVDDTAAPEFMAALYARLAKHESPSAALWKTQSEMLARSTDPLRTASQCGAWNLESAGWER